MLSELAEYTVNKEDIFLVDTNVLIKVFYPVPGAGSSTMAYDSFLNKIVGTGAKICITSIQVSEFVNRCIRFQFGLYKEAHSGVTDFKKEYRETPDYKVQMDGIIEIVKDILKQYNSVPDSFDIISSSLFDKESYAFDFNDALIAKICKEKKYKLVTDDSDFFSFVEDIDIVTNNKTLLMFKGKH